MKVCHVTSAHPIDDVRIYHKECLSLFEANFNVQLLGVLSGRKIDPKIKYSLIKLEKINLLKRFLVLPFMIYKVARKINADLYHFHDPELLVIAGWLKRKGKKIIFDVHEDVPRAIIGRSWSNKLIRSIISNIYEYIENKYMKKFDAVISATPYINSRFEHVNKNSVTINNYPNLSEIVQCNSSVDKKKQICYSGIINEPRGLHNIIKAINLVNIKFLLIGNFSNLKYKKELEEINGWSRVEYVGYLSRDQMMQRLTESSAGIITFLPLPNHINSQPNKIFEYMASGIPVIASDFPLWKEIINECNCGICVNPESPEEIAKAIKFILDNPEESRNMGENGLKSINEKFNWQIESKKLISLYKKIMNE